MSCSCEIACIPAGARRRAASPHPRIARRSYRSIRGSPRCGKDAAVGEPGHGGGLVALEREDEQSVWPRDRGLGGREVATEGWLAIGARRHEPQGRAAADGAVVQEGADRDPALVLVRLGRHRQPGVVGEQGDDGVDVADLERVREAADDVPLELGVRERRAFASGGGQA
jgi:hypothetical protein